MAKTFTDFYQGEGRSEYDQTAFDVVSNVDTSTILGLAQGQYALKLDNATINEPCYQAQDNAGNLYCFSSTTGKVWKRAVTTGVVTLVHTNANGAHYNARYFNGYIYFCSLSNLGSYNINSGVWTDSVAVLANGSSYHPMEECNAILHIGDGNDISSIDENLLFNQSALDLPANYNVTSLLNDNSYLLVGTLVTTTTVEAKAFYWDTYSSSWTIDDTLLAINYFIKADNDVFMSANPIRGTDTWIYYWNGNKGERFKVLRGVLASVKSQGAVLFGDKPLIIAGRYVYSLYKPSQNFSYGLIREYTADGEITSISAVGDELFVSTASGLYTIDTENRATAIITTPVIMEKFDVVEVPYEYINGCTITLETNINNDGWVTETNFINDSVRSMYYLRYGVSYHGHVNFGKVRITLNPVSGQTPRIKSINTY